MLGMFVGAGLIIVVLSVMYGIEMFRTGGRK